MDNKHKEEKERQDQNLTLIERKDMLHSVATALAMSVLPVPSLFFYSSETKSQQILSLAFTWRSI
jgi:hypothetical protein